MQIHKTMGRVETPVPSFLYRKFERYEWRKTIDDLELMYYDDMIWRTIGDIDDLEIPIHKKIKIMHDIMNKFPMVSWTVYFNKALYNRYTSVINYIYDDIEDYLDNLCDYENAQEMTLLLLYTAINAIYVSGIDVTDYNEYVNKLSDVLFVYNRGMCVNVKHLAEFECVLDEILELVIEDIDMILEQEYRVVDFMEKNAYNSYLDPSMVEFELYIEEEFEELRATCIDYVNNLVKYCGFRNSPFIKEEYEHLNTQLARYFNNNYREAVFTDINMLVMYHSIKAIYIFYEDLICYNYEEAFELTKFTKFLFKGIPIDFTKVRYY